MAFVTPLLQMGALGVRQEQRALCELLGQLHADDHVYLTSPYFNITDEFRTTLLHDCAAHVTMVTASPRTSGFFGAGGLKSIIPAAYSMMEERLWYAIDSVQRRQRTSSRRIELREWFRAGWTFHGKGLWVVRAGDAAPALVSIGSSNYG